MKREYQKIEETGYVIDFRKELDYIHSMDFSEVLLKFSNKYGLGSLLVSDMLIEIYLAINKSGGVTPEGIDHMLEQVKIDYRRKINK